MLPTWFCRYKVWAAIEIELEDSKLRIQHAENLTFAAIYEGVIPSVDFGLLIRYGFFLTIIVVCHYLLILLNSFVLWSFKDVFFAVLYFGSVY